MNYSRIMIAAPKSGSGKTTITCGLLAVLKAQGMNPCSFKCGPDYIDPMFHRTVLEIPSGNLDTFFTDDDTTRQLFAKEYSGNIAVIEGVMGLYDGVGGTEETGSSYDLARVLKAPIILVLDAKGAGRSILAEIKGFLDYDKHNLIKGVILNRTSPAFGDKLGELIEKELKIKYLGSVPATKGVELSSRHLGLVLPEEIETIHEKLELMANAVAQSVDTSKIIKIAESAAKLDIIEDKKTQEQESAVRLAVAYDRAFCFYYRENLQLLQDMGAELVYFSPLNDKHLPENISGLLLGGGYPENYLRELSRNSIIKSEIKSVIESGMPVLAECGGFMYLMDSVSDKENRKYDMAGAISGAAWFVGKLVRFGYVTIDDGKMKIRGHEFHYYDTDNNGEACVAKKPMGGKQWQCTHHFGGSYAGFPHLYYPSNPDFVKNFVEAMKNYGE
ncbi:cobyrinate a,c-diamide synthase [Pseudobutyrivibrio xylanivorans]|uniref:Cobyrinate a,c-diamide synthase n=1 Tax=Pseudobutyrivibrio xylanivorans TaxID=185007 RepID=A0A5P6VT95_PSEXY|nr:cobyrinate a,c-diamide synthase [Pseudobutyrivibrio xylanivorans]QFJ55846.1 cobyrinate a,c-diamide synthase [Pseudobutyrivibrio xylanivorans]